jgi:hypothetical protein
MLRRELAQIEHEASPLTTLHPTHAAELAHVQAAAPDKPRRFARAVEVLREHADGIVRPDPDTWAEWSPEDRVRWTASARTMIAECEAAAELLEAAESEER